MFFFAGPFCPGLSYIGAYRRSAGGRVRKARKVKGQVCRGETRYPTSRRYGLVVRRRRHYHAGISLAPFRGKAPRGAPRAGPGSATESATSQSATLSGPTRDCTLSSSSRYVNSAPSTGRRPRSFQSSLFPAAFKFCRNFSKI